MTRLTKPIAVSVHGDPRTKGSMKCIGKIGNRKHVLVEDQGAAVKKWRRIVDPAGDTLRELAGGVLACPLGVELVFTLDRPAGVSVWDRPWPHVRVGDVDKLARCILDALTVHHDRKTNTMHGVLADDAVVCELLCRKVYPDTPDAPDRLTRPGVVIRLYPITEPPAELPYEHVLDQDERTGA
ncbi:hypothetical protein ACXJJ3_26720 [Kribbella sp. WER1]